MGDTEVAVGRRLGSQSGAGGRLRAATPLAIPLLVALGLSRCGPKDVGHDPSDGTAGASAQPTVILDAGDEPATPPDGVELCPAGDCNYQSGVGCAAAEACRPTATDAGTVQPACAPAGASGVGGTCLSWSDCGPGLICVEGTCRRLCCGGDWSVCPDGEGCIRQLSVQVAAEALPSGGSLCYPVDNCDPFDLESCGTDSGRTCQIVDARGSVACAPAGAGEVGDPCDRATPCGVAMTCVAATCRRLCQARLDVEQPCPPDEGVCVHFQRDPEGVGECTPL